MDEREIDRCVEVAAAIAIEEGVACERAVPLACSSNVVVDLQPTPVVARVGFRLARLWPDGGRARMNRELELAGWLAERGSPVVAPSEVAGGGLHEREGRLVSFWERAEPLTKSPDFAAAAAGLVELHADLRDYEGEELGYLVPILDYIPLLIDELEISEALDEDRLRLLRKSFERIVAGIGELSLGCQPLHGDPHTGNLMAAPDDGRLLFIDFEDCCEGPVHWDLASLAGASPKALERALEAYGGEIDPLEVRPFVEARTLQGAAWLALKARDEKRWAPRCNLIFEELAEIERAAAPL